MGEFEETLGMVERQKIVNEKQLETNQELHEKIEVLTKITKIQKDTMGNLLDSLKRLNELYKSNCI